MGESITVSNSRRKKCDAVADIIIVLILIAIVSLTIAAIYFYFQHRSYDEEAENITTTTTSSENDAINDNNMRVLDLAQVNKAANVTELSTLPLPIKKLTDLKPRNEYYISNLIRVQMQYAERIAAEIARKYIVFLPVRMSKVFNMDKDLFDGMLHAAYQKQLILIFHGGKYNSVEFRMKV